MTVAEDKGTGDVNGYKTTFSVTLNYARNNLSRSETLWIEEEYLMIAPDDDASTRAILGQVWCPCANCAP